MVIFVIFFPGMLNSSSIFFYKVNSLGIGTKWRQQGPRNRTIETSGTLWTDEYLQVVMTSQNVDLQELQILLKGGGGGGGGGERFKLILAINTFSVKFLSGEYNTSLVISQQWFRQWLGAVKQQAITWANVYPDLWRHMASLGHNALT